jgi:hypothetical protein
MPRFLSHHKKTIVERGINSQCQIWTKHIRTADDTHSHERTNTKYLYNPRSILRQRPQRGLYSRHDVLCPTFRRSSAANAITSPKCSQPTQDSTNAATTQDMHPRSKWDSNPRLQCSGTANICVSVNVKLSLSTPSRYIGGMEMQPHSTSVLDGGRSASRPGHFTPRKESRYPFNKLLGMSRCRSGWSGEQMNLLHLSGPKPESSSPLPSYYSEWDIPPPPRYVAVIKYIKTHNGHVEGMCDIQCLDIHTAFHQHLDQPVQNSQSDTRSVQKVLPLSATTNPLLWSLAFHK